MRTTNRFVPSRRTSPAGATAIEMVSVPPMWMSWRDNVRMDYLRSLFPQLPGETYAQYLMRLRRNVLSTTVRAWAGMRVVRPAGDVNAYDFGSFGLSTGVQDFTSNTGTGTDTTSTNKSGLSDSQVNSIGNNVASILGDASNIVIAAIRGQAGTDQARIQADAATKLAEIRAQQSSTTDPAQQSALSSMAAQLQAALTAMQANSGMSTTEMIALGIGGVVVVGGLLYFLMRRPRHNPVLYKRGKHGHMEPNRFVSSRHLRAMTGK